MKEATLWESQSKGQPTTDSNCGTFWEYCANADEDERETDGSTTGLSRDMDCTLTEEDDPIPTLMLFVYTVNKSP